MNIRKITELQELISLYKEVFDVHNIFTKEDSVILDYLENFKGKFIAAFDENKLVGALAISVIKYDNHQLIRFKHIAVAEGFQGKGIGSALLAEAESIAGKGKVEIHVGESEKRAVEFYEKNGYAKEGALKYHYRPDEICYIMGKVI